MAIQLKILAAATGRTADETIAVPASKSWLVKNISITRTGVDAVSVTINVKKGTDTVPVTSLTALAQNTPFQFPYELTLTAAEEVILDVNATGAGKEYSYVLTGIERDI